MRAFATLSESLARLTTRIDVRLAVSIGATTALLSACLLYGLLAYATLEALEEKYATLDQSLTAAVGGRHGPNDASTSAPTHEDFAYVTTDDRGTVLAARGPWPIGTGRALTPSLRTALFASENDYLVLDRSSTPNETIHAALLLRHFVHERGELGRRGAWVVLIGIMSSLALGVISARWALEPVRRTAAVVREVDSRRLGIRVPTRGTSDEIDRLAAAINDVLARLEWSFDRLSRFSADVAHELRTPVNRMLTEIDVALMRPTGEALSDNVLEEIRNTTDEMRVLVDQLLFLAGGEEGRVPLAREPVDVASVVDRLAELYIALAEDSGRRFEVVSARVTAEIDRQLVERALAILLDNALRHSDPGSRIRTSVEARHEFVLLTIEDSGPGIPVGERERIFERFVRLDPARDRSGIGLGLSIARMIARLHGGALWVESSALGGAAFRFELPRHGSGRSP